MPSLCLPRLVRSGGMVLACVLAAEAALAATPDATASPVAAVLARLDRDGDGRLDRTEYLEFRQPRFARADADGDAALSAAEFEASLPAAARAGVSAQFAARDVDHSGGLAVSEMDAYHAGVFARFLDGDADGYLSVAEIQRMLQPAAAPNAPMDADGNGSVTVAEYLDFQTRRFPTLDADTDGSLSFTEFKSSLAEQAMRTARDSFRGFDLNSNNRLSPREFVTYHDFVFRRVLDRDRDERVTMEEFAALLQR